MFIRVDGEHRRKTLNPLYVCRAWQHQLLIMIKSFALSPTM